MTPLQGHTDLIAGPEDTGFTRGPWEFRAIDLDGFGYVEFQGHPGDCIAHIGDQCWSPRQNLANGRLIASAPALVNLVEQMLAAIDAGSIDSPEQGEPEVGIPIHKWHEEWEHYARAAISQARGTQP